MNRPRSDSSSRLPPPPPPGGGVTGVGSSSVTVNTTLSAKIDTVNTTLTAKIENANTTLTAKIDDVNKTLNTKIDKNHAETTAAIAKLGEGIAGLRGLQKAILWVLGGVGGLAVVLSTVGKALHWF